MKLKTRKINLYLTSDKELVNKTVNKMSVDLSLKNSKQKSALKLLLCNLFVYSDEAIAVPRKRNTLGPSRYNPFKVGYSSLNSVLDRLHGHGLIEQSIGRKELKTGKGKLTLIEPTDSLKVALHLSEWLHEYFYEFNPEVIRLKTYIDGSNSKKLIDYEDTEVSNKLRKEMHDYINVLNENIISLDTKENNPEWEFDGSPVYRTFIRMSDSEQDFRHGGRIYGVWASLTKKQRSFIRINNNETVEIDFAASHVNTMYLMQTGSRYPYNEDPYALRVNNKLIPRDVMKKLSSILINVNTVKGAIEALENEYRSSRSSAHDYSTDLYEFAGITNSSDLINIIDAYLAKHHPIYDLFLKGKNLGNHIQFMESQRVMDVVNKFVEMGIPVLTVFDSFIVQRKHERLLLNLMNNDQSNKQVA